MIETLRVLSVDGPTRGSVILIDLCGVATISLVSGSITSIVMTQLPTQRRADSSIGPDTMTDLPLVISSATHLYSHVPPHHMTGMSENPASDLNSLFLVMAPAESLVPIFAERNVFAIQVF
jgi:hypothetical protein